MSTHRTSGAPSWLPVFGVALILWATPASAFHFPWDQGHDIFTPDNGDDDNDPGDDSCPPNTCCLDSRGASPVEVASGNFIYRLRVFRLEGLGPEIDLTLTYNSRDNRRGPFGHGWVHRYDRRLVETTDGAAVVAICSKANGKRERFVREPDGSYAPPEYLFDTLTKEADGGFRLRDHLGGVRTFDTHGRLSSVTDRNGNSLTFNYDATGFMVSITDAVNRSVVFAKGGDGRVASMTDPAGRVFQFSYDANGELVGYTDPLGQTTTFTYDGKANLTAVIDPNGNTEESLTYDSSGRVATHTEGATTWTYQYLPSLNRTIKRDSAGNTWTVDYNDSGVATRRTDPLGKTELLTYDQFLNVTSRTDERSRTTTMTYDDRGNMLTLTDPAGGVRQMTYEPTFNRLLTRTDAGSNTTTFAYDERGNLIRRTDALGNVTALEYDGTGQVTRITYPESAVYSFGYDAYGNLSSVTDPLGNTSHATFDVLGKVVETTDAAGRVTSYVYDDTERLVEAIDARNDSTLLSYDASGNLVGLTLPTGATVGFEYDALNRLVRRVGPLGDVTTFSYDTHDNLVSRRDPKGQEIHFSYDALDRLVSRQRVEDTVGYAYDAVGNLLSVTDGDSQVSFSYDALDRVVTASTAATSGQPASTLQYSYDAVGNVIILTDSAGGNVQYTYDALSRLTRITDAAAMRVFDLAYDGLSRRTSVQGPSGVGTVSTYDLAGQLVSQVLAGGGTTESLDFQYDAVGNRTSRTDGSGVHQYSYDPLSQLTGVTHSVGAAESYVYDVIGNRTSSHLSSTYQVNLRNQILADDTFDYSYDANGNLISATERATGSATIYSYDSDDQLIRIDFPDSRVATYRYDGLGRRIAKTIDGQSTQYVYDNHSILLEYVGGALAARYTQTPEVVDETLAVDRQGAVTYLQSDGLGSIVRTVADDGTVTDLSYDGFGQPLGGTNGSAPFAFQGREYDEESGLYYFRARYYHPRLGRFLGEDPLGFTASLNLYAFARNNPVNLTDPSGLQTGRGFWGFLEDVVEFFPDAFGADKDFWDNYTDMRDANTIGADKYFHCKANCEAARRGPGGATEASLVSETRELLDQYIKGDPPAACNADRAANDHGREAGRKNRNVDCRKACNKFRPRGLDPKY